MAEEKMCVFCQIPKEQWILDNESFYCAFDINPVEKGHALIISKRHFENFFGMNDKEVRDFFDISQKLRLKLQEKFKPKAFNLAANIGKEAGQIVFHAHIHLIPRY